MIRLGLKITSPTLKHNFCEIILGKYNGELCWIIDKVFINIKPNNLPTLKVKDTKLLYHSWSYRGRLVGRIGCPVIKFNPRQLKYVKHPCVSSHS